ncbi:hypothetical protein AAFF_G00357860 [Aldrovandia affinis]|uniref:Uncharacterized protein n=1 Tax=Aldrovandia affinis TaxID=143900 RepID=A0AAD7T995_9TELE|nr:hypothetical protein AAFF_G00357860 [Aldrovandia affinis]
MPVAVRTKSWEEHVTHRVALQYSFDDLDLHCCHGIVFDGRKSGTDVSKSERRERCASLPECCHELRADGLSFIQARMNTVDIDENANHPGPGHFLSMKCSTETLVNESDRNSINGSSNTGLVEPDWTSPPEAGPSYKDTPPAETLGDGADPRDDGSSSERGSERSDKSVRSPFEEGLAPVTGSDKASNNEGAVSPVFVDSEREGAGDRIDRSPNSDAIDVRPTEMLGNVSEDDDAIPYAARGHPESLPPCETELSLTTDKAIDKTVMGECHNVVSKTGMISDVALCEAMHFPPVLGDCKGANSNISMISEEPSSDAVDGQTRECDKPALRTDVVSEIQCYGEADCQKLSGELNNATSEMDIIGEVPHSGRNPIKVAEAEAEENDHKAEDGAVKLRKRKGSKEERERSHLDSMVLLIMKLDQLDQDIENALSATSSISNTPTVKRRNVHGTDPETINGGDPFHSTHQQKFIPHMIYSSLTSGPMTSIWSETQDWDNAAYFRKG